MWPRTEANVEYESVMTLIKLVTEPGVVANLLDVLRDAGLEHDQRHLTADSKRRTAHTASSSPSMPRLGRNLSATRWWKWPNMATGAKTIAVYPRREQPNPPVNSWMLPQGGVRLDSSASTSDWQTAQNARRELLW